MNFFQEIYHYYWFGCYLSESGGLRMKQVTHVTRFCFVFLIPKDQKNQCRYKMIRAFWPLESLKPTVLLSILKLRLWFILGNSAKNSSSAKSCFQKWFFFYMFTFPVRVECWIALKARLRSSTLQPENECKCWDFRGFFLVGEGLVLVEGLRLWWVALCWRHSVCQAQTIQNQSWDARASSGSAC